MRARGAFGPGGHRVAKGGVSGANAGVGASKLRLRTREEVTMKALIPLAVATLLTACAQVAPAPEADPVLFRDAIFGPPSAPVRAADVFAVSDEMRRYLVKEMGGEMEA